MTSWRSGARRCDTVAVPRATASARRPGGQATEAERELGLKTLIPPWPPSDLTPGQWIAALGSLPLLDQPGTRWRYNTGATVAGVLIERVAGAPLADVLRERVFEPLGMTDTGFWVPAAKRDRFTTFYAPGGPDGGLRVLDPPDGWDGGSGTAWRTDREAGLTGILLTQRMATSPEPVALVRDFWAAAYAAAGA